jgi:hypothetical protein
MFTFTLRRGLVGICTTLQSKKMSRGGIFRSISTVYYASFCSIWFLTSFFTSWGGGEIVALSLLIKMRLPFSALPSQPSIHRVRLFSSLSPTSSYLEKVVTSVIRLVIVHSPIFYSASRCLPLETRNYRLAASAVIRRHPMVPLLDPRGQQSGLRGESPKITFPPGQRRIRHSYRRSLRKTPFLPSPKPSRNTNQMARASW